MILAAYLVGSLSFSAIVAKANGVDIFSSGSGNPGATNVHRTVGIYAGRLVFVLDLLKGFLPCLAALHFLSIGNGFNVRMATITLFGVLCGHNFSIFHGFRGGKGISSTMGGILAIMPCTLVVGVFVWGVIFHATRIVSVASLCFTASVLLTSYLFSYPQDCVIFSLILNVMVFWKHRGNILRLINGTEYKFSDKN
jgi:glycerol-3-phosphate acyltransferase PlsY